MKKLIITTAFLFAAFLMNAQSDSSAIQQFLQKIHGAYDQAGKLSFKVEYKYANKSKPGNYIDTLSGNISMDKNRMYFMVAGTETIINTKYTIKVIADEQLIYLNKVQRDAMLDPVSILDTLLVKAGGGHASVVKDKQTSTMHIKYPAGNMYKQISLTIDDRTGLFQKVVYDIYTTDLVSNDQLGKPGAATYESEGKVEVIFSNYKEGTFSDSLFDETKYFKRQGNNFEPAERYNGYRVFVASPNL